MSISLPDLRDLNSSILYDLLLSDWGGNNSHMGTPANLSAYVSQLDNNTLNAMDTLYDNMRGGHNPPPPSVDIDLTDFDYHEYLDDLSKVRVHWTQDQAFWPHTIVYGLAFIIGVIGNSLVVFALVADRKSRNVTASFLVSLAVADLLFLLLCVPYEISKFFIGYWQGGAALCKISAFIEMLSASASILNLGAVSVERYIVIVHPMRSRTWCTMGNTKKIVVAVWVVACLLSSPVLYIMNTTTFFYYNNTSYVTTVICSDTNYSSNSMRIVFAWYQLIVMYILPTVLMVYCYAIVIHVLWISTKELAKMTRANGRRSDDETREHLTGGTRTNHATSGTRVNTHGNFHHVHGVRDQSAEIREARKQVIKMLLTIITVFLVCWGPKLVLNLLKRHDTLGNVLHTNAAFYIMLVIHLLPYVQSACNPLIYGFMSNKFRQSMRAGCRSHCSCVPTRFLPQPNRNYHNLSAAGGGGKGGRPLRGLSSHSSASSTTTACGGGSRTLTMHNTSMTMISEC